MESKYFIVNYADAPKERLVAEKIGDALFYLDSDLREYFPNMLLKNATPIEDFGFKVEEIDEAIVFMRIGESIATYRDGKPRKWQGTSKNFAYKKGVLWIL